MTRSTPDRLFVAVDGSEGGKRAAAYGGQLARRLGVPLTLLFALPDDPLEMFGMSDEGSVRYFQPEAFEQLRQEVARAAFDGARQALGETDLVIDEEILTGKPGAALVARVAGQTDGLIVMGRRGLSRAGELLMGSVTQRVLHHADCPVLVVH
ncbi:universal stress protein [Methylonatrum kenyense]|uniref:universal stress protein n=1 Tax=Methylonatrum kenyense TaxID=455253 RepID=UPI0020BE0543|nr:universal stress protein [Methylonatrum kenyense]MCK8515356.1 universal stress protein [Methylonatrum kenyense]